MKKLLSLFILMLLPMVASADTVDDYRPFIEDGKVWTYHYYNDFTGKEFYESLTVSGDTIINNKSYKKIVDVATGRVYCALREEGHKVYVNYPNHSGESLLYDFGLNVGDTFPLYEGSDPSAWATVVSVDTIVVGSRAFRALDVRPNNTKEWPNWWVEGIGGMYHLTSNSPMPGNSYYFSSCQLEGDTLFTSRDFQTLGTIPSIGTQTSYYYYKGNKIPLTLNENKVIVSIPKEYDEISKRIRANIPVLRTIKGDIFDSFIIPGPDFEKLTSKDFWEEDAKSVILTSSYYTQDNEEVFETPYLNVKLKKEEDADLLASYAERYGLKIVGNSNYLPLWYILYVTLDSEKSPLQCANEIFESGEFAASVPDFASNNYGIEVAYRPFVEDGKVWKVGSTAGISDGIVRMVEYYYFDGDTIIDGKTCKQMMCQRFVSPEHPDYAEMIRFPLLRYVGAWYEEDKKVYFSKQFRMMYDFSLGNKEELWMNYVVGPKQIGGLEGFKGVYRDVMWNNEIYPFYYCTTWLEGVGGIDGPTVNIYYGKENHALFLMSCAVGDEVIYLNDKYEDVATPEGARKGRFDFTHTIKPKPKSPIKREESDADQSVYGEYNDLRLDIHLAPLDEAYQVTIADESGQAVYEKTVNAGSIVGLSIDISAYAKGRYIVTVENSDESFTGEFETQTSGISDAARLNNKGKKIKDQLIYNLQGQRLSSLQKGLNIVDGRKVYVK